jgi:hypothetical protein
MALFRKRKIEGYLPKPGETLRDSQVYPEKMDGSGREAFMQIIPVDQIA